MDNTNTSIVATTASTSSNTEFALPDSTWDEGRLIDYMRHHEKALGGLDRKTLKHEFCIGAAAQLKYIQLDGKWTAWAKDQGYPLETFRRRRLLYVRAGSLQALDKYTSKMEAYYELSIYRRPNPSDLDALDAEYESRNGGRVASDIGNMPPVSPKDGTTSPAEPEDGDSSPAEPERQEARTSVAPGGEGDRQARNNEGRPREVVLRELEDRYADQNELLRVDLPTTTRMVLDFLCSQEEADLAAVLARAVREYWLRHGDPTRMAPALGHEGAPS